MRGIVVLEPLVLMACSSHDADDARKCGVTENELREAIEQVSEMAPYSGKDVGRCNVIVDDAKDVHVITPEIQRSVEEMMAGEEAEAKN